MHKLQQEWLVTVIFISQKLLKRIKEGEFKSSYVLRGKILFFLPSVIKLIAIGT